MQFESSSLETWKKEPRLKAIFGFDTDLTNIVIMMQIDVNLSKNQSSPCFTKNQSVKDVSACCATQTV